MERSKLICTLVGWYAAKNNTITAEDLRILIDNHLFKCNMPPLGSEDGDVPLMQELLDEIIISVLSRGINRSTRRQKW